MTVAGLLSELSMDEFTQWKALYTVEAEGAEEQTPMRGAQKVGAFFGRHFGGGG